MDTQEAPESSTAAGHDALAAFRWWENMRWIYNLAVGLVGLTMAALMFADLTLPDLVGAVIYGLIANVFYCLGFVTEMGDQYYFKGALRMYRYRMALFLVGTLGSMLLTFVIGWAYSMVIGLPPIPSP